MQLGQQYVENKNPSKLFSQRGVYIHLFNLKKHA